MSDRHTVAVMNLDHEVVRVIGEGMSEHNRDKAERGLLRNLNVDHFFVWTGTDAEAKKLKQAPTLRVTYKMEDRASHVDLRIWVNGGLTGTLTVREEEKLLLIGVVEDLMSRFDATEVP